MVSLLKNLNNWSIKMRRLMKSDIIFVGCTCWKRLGMSVGYSPPKFIFPKKRVYAQLQNNDPVGALCHCSNNNPIKSQLF